MSRSFKKGSLPEDSNRRRQRDKASKKPGSADVLRDSGHLSTPRSTGRDVYLALAVCGFLLLAVAVVFGQTVNSDFVNLDDPDYVCTNDHVRQGLTFDGIAWAMTTNHSNNWHPLTWLSHMLDCQFYGLHAGGHHLTSVLLHAATVVLLFLIFWQMTSDLWPSAFVAAVFAVHPLHVESVAWVAERKDVLSGLFFALTLGAYLLYVRRPFSLLRYLAVAAMFALGLMAKPMLVTLPFVLLLLDYWPLGRMGGRAANDRIGHQDGGCAVALGAKSQLPPRPISRLVVEKIPLLLLSAASCAMTAWAQREAITDVAEVPLSSRIANGLVSYASYLGESVCPINLAAYYPHPQAGLPTWKSVAAFVVLASITAAVLARWRKNPYMLVGWLWYLGMLVPVIGLVQVGLQAKADRYMYLPQIGLSIALTWGILSFVRSRSTAPVFASPRMRLSPLTLCGAVASLAVVELMACAMQQTTYWRDSEVLWTHTLKCTSQNSFAHHNFGFFLAHEGRLGEAIDQFQEAVRIKPDFVEAHINLGVAFARLERFDEAATQFEKALNISPNAVEIRNNLAFALERGGRVDEAMAQFQKVLVLAKQQNNQALVESVLAEMRLLQAEVPNPK